MLTFLIPVRHQETAKNWPEIKSYLAKTIQSLAAQEHPDWQAVIVANNGADLPAMPSKVDVCFVDIPPAILPDMRDRPKYNQAVREDKGARLLAGLVQSQPKGHVMVVDFDVLVSNRLARLVAENPDSPGWYFDSGYLYSGGDDLLFYETGFWKLCGTSHIVRTDLLGVPASIEDADERLKINWLGSHKSLKKDMALQGTPLMKLPFPGAVYRTGHADSTSRSRNVSQYIKSKSDAGDSDLQKNLCSITSVEINEFFGGLAS